MKKLSKKTLFILVLMFLIVSLSFLFYNLNLHRFFYKPDLPISGTNNKETVSQRRLLSELVPTKVFDFALNEVIEGERAIEVAVRSHKGEIERVKNMAIGYYEGDLSIWFTQYPDAVIARNETIKMADAMKRFGQGFEKIEEISTDEVVVYRTLPEGKEQFFWAQDDLMIYIMPGSLTENQSQLLVLRLISIIKKEWSK